MGCGRRPTPHRPHSVTVSGYNEQLDLEVPAGTVLGLLGPNGAGKTTAVRILTTLAVPDAGRATVAGHDVVTEAMAVRRSIGVTAQDAAVDEMLTGRQNLVMIGRLAGLGRPPSSGPWPTGIPSAR